MLVLDTIPKGIRQAALAAVFATAIPVFLTAVNLQGNVTAQGSGATKSGKKGEPAKARRKAARALTPFLRAVER